MILFLFLILNVLAQAISPFKDKDLNALLEQSKRQKSVIVVYTWSPHMNLSVRGLTELQNWSQEKRLTPVVIRDPKSTQEMSKQVLENNKLNTNFLTTNESSKLIKMGLRTHYPSYLFIKNGKIVSPVIPGYKSAAELNALSSRYLQ